MKDLVLLLRQLLDQGLEIVVGERGEIGQRFHDTFRWRARRRSKAAPRRGVNLSRGFYRGSRRVHVSLHDLLDELAHLALELLGRLRAFALGVDVHERLVRVGQHLRPAALVDQLDPVREVEVAAGEALVQARMTTPFFAQGRRGAGGSAIGTAARR